MDKSSVLAKLQETRREWEIFLEETRQQIAELKEQEQTILRALASHDMIDAIEASTGDERDQLVNEFVAKFLIEE